MNPQSKEILNWSPDEKITINSFEDFKKKIHISELPEWELKEFFSDPIETTQGKLDELRKSYIKWEPNLSTVKDFLESSRLSIIAESKQKVEEVKKVSSYLNKSIKFEKIKNIDWKKTEALAEKDMDTFLNKTDKVWWEIWKTLNDGVKKAKVVWKKIKEGWYTVQLWEAMNDAFSKLKKFDIFWALASLLKWLFGMFVWNEVLKKAWEKVKEVLSSQDIETTKNNIKATLLKEFPEKEEYIDKVLKDPKVLTEWKIKYFYEKIKSWKWITLNDLINEFDELNITTLLTEKAEKFKNKLYSDIQEEIQKKYNKTLDAEQVKNLWKLIATNLTVDKENIEALQSKFTDEHKLQIKDITPIFLEWTKNSIWFMFWLVTENIISINDIAINFSKKWWELVKITLWKLWLSEEVNIDDLYENFSSMEEEDKAILIWLLYRKGGLFLNIIWSLSSLTSKLLIETVLPTNSWVDWIRLWYDALIHWNKKQIENFQKIENALSSSKVTSVWQEFLDEAIENLNKVKKNFTVLEILKQSNWDVDKFYQKISDFEIKNNIKFDRVTNFKKLSQSVSEYIWSNFASSFDAWSIRNIKNVHIWFWTNDAIQEFNKKLENITKNQSRIAKWVLNLNPFKKLTDAIDISKVSKLWDSLLFELRSPDDAKSFLKQANELAKKSPELIKWIFDKLPIIAIWGLATTWEEPFFESFKNELPYLIPVVWPIMMISDAWVNWNNMPPTFMKWEQAAIAWGLLTLDWFFLYKAWLRWAPAYIAKPIKDLYDIWKGTAEIWQRLYKTWRVLENWKTIKTIFSNALNKTRTLKWKVKALAIIALIWYWAVEVAFAEDKTWKYDKYIKNWKLNKEQIKSDSESLNEWEKIDLIKIILNKNCWDEIFKDITYNIVWNNTLSINSNNDKYQESYFINNNIKEILNELFWINNIEFKYNKKPA